MESCYDAQIRLKFLGSKESLPSRHPHTGIAGRCHLPGDPGHSLAGKRKEAEGESKFFCS